MIALTQLRETVLRVMKKYGLLSEIRRRRKWVNLGQQVYQYKNLFARQFRADRPNSKWVADISYIQTKEGVLYLSMIRDLYDNSIVAYRTSSRQTVNLVLDAIRLAMKKKKKRVAAELQLHSDQGFQYTSHLQFCAHPKQNWSGAADAAPLRLKRNNLTQGLFLCCPHNLGQSTSPGLFASFLHERLNTVTLLDTFSR